MGGMRPVDQYNLPRVAFSSWKGSGDCTKAMHGAYMVHVWVYYMNKSTSKCTNIRPVFGSS